PWNRRALRVLDCDDYESEAHLSIARLAARVGALSTASAELAAIYHFKRLENEMLPRFDRILLSSLRDVLRMRGAHPGASVHHVPNAFPLLPKTPFGLERGSVLMMLFVGTLDYIPNADGILYF